MTQNNEKDVNVILMGVFCIFALPRILESAKDTVSDITIDYLVTELNKLTDKYQFDNKFVSQFILNLKANTQSYMMMKTMAIFILLNNNVNKLHWVWLQSKGVIKQFSTKLTSKVARGKAKQFFKENQDNQALIIREDISNRLKTWGTSAHMTNAYATGGSLFSMKDSARTQNLKTLTNKDIGTLLKEFYTITGFGSVSNV